MGFLELSNVSGYDDNIGSFFCKETSCAFAESCRSTSYENCLRISLARAEIRGGFGGGGSNSLVRLPRSDSCFEKHPFCRIEGLL